jgi:DTW domain-containing protein YfiP
VNSKVDVWRCSMVHDCDMCGLNFSDCTCDITDLEKRVAFLEEELESLTDIVYEMSEFIKEKFK